MRYKTHLHHCNECNHLSVKSMSQIMYRYTSTSLTIRAFCTFLHKNIVNKNKIQIQITEITYMPPSIATTAMVSNKSLRYFQLGILLSPEMFCRKKVDMSMLFLWIYYINICFLLFFLYSRPYADFGRTHTV